MAIRTKEELVSRIDREYIWRLREISEMKSLIGSRDLSAVRKRVLCRSGIALLYAHWEGFVKKSGTYFLEYVSDQRLTIEELNHNFIVLIVKNQMEQSSKSHKNSSFEEITKFLLEKRSSRARIPFKKIVNTESNLSTTVLREISWCLGVDYTFFESKEKLINLRLVGRRNHIAHGEEINIEPDDFLEMAEEVLGLLNTFKNLLENAVITDAYKSVQAA